MQKLGKNLGKYFGETIDIRAVLRDVETAAQQHGWTSEIFYEQGEFKWLALHRARSQLSTLNHQLAFTLAPASTATNLPGHSQHCVCCRKIIGRPRPRFFSCRA